MMNLHAARKHALFARSTETLAHVTEALESALRDIEKADATVYDELNTADLEALDDLRAKVRIAFHNANAMTATLSNLTAAYDPERYYD